MYSQTQLHSTFSSIHPFKVAVVLHHIPRGATSRILMMGEGGPSDFWGSKILAQSSYFFGSMIKSCRDFFGSRKKEQVFFGVVKKVVICSCDFFVV